MIQNFCNNYKDFISWKPIAEDKFSKSKSRSHKQKNLKQVLAKEFLIAEKNQVPMSGEILNEFFKYESALIQKMNLFINQFAEIA